VLGSDHRRLLGAGAAVVLVTVAVVLAVTGASDRGGPLAFETSPPSVDREDLTALEGTLGHAVYWAGDRPPYRFELTEEADGSVFLRYLPPETEAADPDVGEFLTVGTYPVADAQAALRRVAAEAEASVGQIAAGGVVLPNPASEGSVYLAYPGSDLELEVYDPTPGRAMDLIRSGAIRPVGEG
jgi:hypothetical protein